MKKGFLLTVMLSLLTVAVFTVPIFADAAVDNQPTYPYDLYYYSQLSEQEKALYDALAKETSLDALKKGEGVAVTDPFTIAVPQTVTEQEYRRLFTLFDDELGRLSALMPYVPNAVAAFDRDRSDIFWTSGVQCRTVMQQNGQTISGGMSFEVGNTYTVFLEVLLPLAKDWDADGGVEDRVLADDLAVMEQHLSALVGDAMAASDTRYGRLQYLNRALCTYNDYHYEAANGNVNGHYPWTPLAALDQITLNDDANGSLKPVCEGYARAFFLACRRMEIPCILVSGLGNGENHMWNYVQMDDGKWYGVDVTWNDSTGRVDSYFLIGKDVMDQKHIPQSQIISGQNLAFVFPTLADTAYDPETQMQHTHAYGDWQPHNDREHLRVCSCGLAEYGDHSFGEWTEEKAATEAESGYRIHSCACGRVERQEIARLTHEYEQTVTAPTCTDGGYTVHVCKNCGDSYRTDERDPLGHVYEEGQSICAVCGEVYLPETEEPIEKDTEPSKSEVTQGESEPDLPDENGAAQNGAAQNGFATLLFGGCQATVASGLYILLCFPPMLVLWKKRSL